MSSGVIQDIVYVVALIGIGIPLGLYIYKVMTGKLTWKPIAALERFTNRQMHINPEEEQTAAK